MGSGKDDPVLLSSNAIMLLEWRLTLSKVLIASTLSVALSQLGGVAAAQTSDNKKSGLEPVAATSPASKSAMSDPGAQKAIPPKADLSKSSNASTPAADKKPPASNAASTAAAADKADKLPFPNISSDGLTSLSGIHTSFSHVFPSAIDIHGSSAGVLLHARKETKYDLLTPLSIWLEEGPLLVSVRAPSELVLVATKFGDICVTAGGDALVDRAEETLRIVNLSTNDTVFLNMHDKLWTNSPWGHLNRVQQLNEKDKSGKKGKKSRSRTYDDIESGCVAIEPGYELIIGSEALQMEEVKRQDGIGRRDFKTLTNGIFVLNEISVDNLAQSHDLIKNLKEHGPKANNVLSDITKSASNLKSKQGEQGFEKVFPPPPKPPKKPPTPPKTPPASTIGKPKKDSKDTKETKDTKDTKDSSNKSKSSPSSTPSFPSTIPGTGSAPPAAPSTPTPINPPTR